MMIKKALKYTVLGMGVLSILFVLTLMYAYFVEPAMLVVNAQTVKVPYWSRELNGFKVVAISDLHGGSHTITEERLRSVAELANAQDPDVVVLLGDFVSQKRSHSPDLKMPIEMIAENLKGLRAKHGVFAVIGNHDRNYSYQLVRGELEGVGFKVLENETTAIDVNGKKVWMLGIEDYWYRGRVDISGALAQIEPKENIIGFTHNPDSFNKTTADLSILFAGHTHGGQVYLPFIGAPLPVSDKEYTRGHVVKDGRNMFVTKGVGTSGPGIRFCAWPEVAVITLESQ